MTSAEIRIRPVLGDDLPAVAELLRHLTGAHPSWNLAYLTWKYLDNPYVERPLGFAAVAGREIVGFRGYHATPWHVPASGHRTLVLSPGDTCVHPDFRRKGLSVRIGQAAMRELRPDSRIFLNMTAGASAVPGYMRMGFLPLADKSRLSLVDLWRSPRGWFGSRRSPLGAVRFGEFGDVQISPDPLPEELARVGMDPTGTESRLTPLPEERFFRWYFSAPRANHVFYFARERGRVVGYVVLRVTAKGRLATIIDYSGRSFSAVAHLFRFLARSAPFAIIWMYGLTPDDELLRLLRELGFREDGPVERARRRMNRVWPFLVRPIAEEPREHDWFFDGLDIRDPSNWDIREIRSDAI